MADFPTFEKNASRERQAVQVTPPALDDNADGEKTAQELFVEQQWRDVANSSLPEDHPLSLNRDADQVTSDPYSN